MRDERDTFFAALLARCSAYPQTCLTLTAIYPDGKHRTPSRHIPVNDIPALHDALERLDAANNQEWGAYFAVGLRRPGLNRWQRGGTADVVALPALFVDVDDPSLDTVKIGFEIPKRIGIRIPSSHVRRSVSSPLTWTPDQRELVGVCL